MGNMVAFSIRHDMVNSLDDLTFEKIGYLHHKLDNKPKASHVPEGSLPEFFEVSDLPGVISTHYHHADGGADLIFSNDWMMRLPFRFNLPVLISKELDARSKANADTMAPLGNQILLKNLKSAVRTAPRKYPIQMQKTGSLQAQPNQCQSNYSVFGYLTDCFSDLERKKDLIPSILDICQTGRVNSRIFNRHSNDIRHLGTFGPETSCVVSMYHNAFFAMPIPFQALDIPVADQKSFLEEYSSGRTVWADNVVDIAGLDLIAKAFGYRIGKQFAPQKEAAWGPK